MTNKPQAMPHSAKPHSMPLGDTDLYTPSDAQPVRVRSRSLPADAHFEPHAHAWAQLAYCASGIVQVTATQAASNAPSGSLAPSAHDQITYIVPPSRAVWIAPGAQHHITVREAAEFRTLYIHADAVPVGWQDCRMIVVTALLREAIQALDTAAVVWGMPSKRQTLLTSLVLDEIAQAETHRLGVPLPHPQRGDKRLRALCEAVMRAPADRATLAEWAADTGASERTVARLFRGELGLSYQQWRQQAVLAHALPLLARGQPVSAVAAATGYASDSAFSVMFKAAMGQTPGQFLSNNRA